MKPPLSIVSIISSLISIAILSSFPVPRREGRPNFRETFWILLHINPFLGTVISVLAAIWQHSIAATATPLVRYLAQGSAVTLVGPIATALVWTAVFVSAIAAAITRRHSMPPAATASASASATPRA